MIKKILFILIAQYAFCSTGFSQTFDQQIKHIALDRDTLDTFGYSVAISGNYAVVGAPDDWENATGTNPKKKSGSAYIFKKTAATGNNWVQIKKIVASNRDTSFYFGKGVGIDSNYIVVGAPGANAIYIFKKDQGGVDNWGEIKIIHPTDATGADSFGQFISIKGEYICVGAQKESDDASGLNPITQAGAAYLFKKDLGGVDNWGQLKKIVASDRNSASVLSWFGASVSLNGNYLVVGASSERKNVSGGSLISGAGACYIYEKNTGGTDNWGFVKKLVSSDRAQDDHLGISVSLFGDDLIVGAWGEDQDASGGNTMSLAGSAYLFNRNQGGANNWGEIKKIVAADRSPADYFGSTVTISYDHILISAPYDHQDENGVNYLTNAGSAYIFSRNEGGAGNWGQIQKITATDREIQDKYSFAAAIDNNEIIVGAPYNDLDTLNINPKPDGGGIYFLEYSSPSIIIIGGGTLKAVVNNATYQWMDCATTSILPGEVNQTFTPSLSGSYAVIVTTLSGVDTSACKKIIVTSNKSIYNSSIQLKAFVNDNQQLIIYNNQHELTKMSLVDIMGREFLSSIIESGTNSMSIATIPSGVYLVRFNNSKLSTTQQLLIQR